MVMPETVVQAWCGTNCLSTLAENYPPGTLEDRVEQGKHDLAAVLALGAQAHLHGFGPGIGNALDGAGLPLPGWGR